MNGRIRINPSLEEIIRILTEHRQTITCAKPCTGGLLAGVLTSIAGSSQWFHQSLAAYGNKAKEDRLSVMPDALLKHGVVSREAVYEMAYGARAVAGAGYVLSVSGIAGPGNGGAARPVDMVWFSLATPTESLERTALFEDDRKSVRNQAVRFVLGWLAKNLTKNI